MTVVAGPSGSGKSTRFRVQDFRGEVYDNSDHEPRLVLRVSSGEVVDVPKLLPDWVREALAGSPLAEPPA